MSSVEACDFYEIEIEAAYGISPPPVEMNFYGYYKYFG